MKTKKFLVWRIFTAASMVAIIFIAGMVVSRLHKKYKRYHNYTATCVSHYSNKYVYEYKKGYVRLKEKQSGKYLTPKLDRIYDGRIHDSFTVFFSGRETNGDF